MPYCLPRQTQLDNQRSRAQSLGWISLLCFFLFAHGARAGTATPAGDTNSPVAQALEKANKLFEAQQWTEARTAYDAARSLEKDWASPPVRLAVEGAVACSLKLLLWDDALSRAEDFVAKTKGKFEEAVGERFLAGLYLTVPHHGTKRGNTFLRGQSTQGVQVYSWRKDARQAVKHYERARELLLAVAAKVDKTKLEAERI